MKFHIGGFYHKMSKHYNFNLDFRPQIYRIF